MIIYDLVVKYLFLYFLIVNTAGCQMESGKARNNESIQVTLTENLDQGFRNPPADARPRVFWWWLNSMATKESITRDLEELKDKGFGGALLFDAGSSSYKIAHKTAAGPVFGSKEWKELFNHALKEADRLGLELSLNIQSGWNPGGPTVTPDDAMKKIVWTEKKISGPVTFTDSLPRAAGEFYHDIVVQAYRQKNKGSYRPIKNWGYKSLNRQFHGGGCYPLYMLREQEPNALGDAELHSDSLIDLSVHMEMNGRLHWVVPEGDWVILRFGYILTGAKVSTASDGYDGLSFDHLSTEALEHFFRDVVDPILASGGDLIGKSLKYLHTDSWEMRLVNWTKNFREDFMKMRGYDPIPFLPVLAGRIVDSREVSNRFLYDFRKTVGDCIADRMYAQFARMAHERGLGLHPESGGPHSAPIDGLKCLGRNDFPVGEFWARSNTHRVREDDRLFIKQSACAAHIYGKRFVAGEGPTTIGPQWERSPKDLKSVFDRNFCEGINRFFWHCFTSSPKAFGLPGNEYFAGTHLNPNATWWEPSKAFIKYLSRVSFLLSQGLFQADVCIYYGDDVPNFVSRKQIIKELGPGYDYDECNAEVLLERMSVKNGKIILPDGMSYHLLRLPDREAITLEVLQKIEQLVKDGATVVGPRPKTSTGLNGYPESEKQVIELAGRLWGAYDGVGITENRYGQGRVLWGIDLRDILINDGIRPDFAFISSQDSSALDYIHRRVENTDIYYVVNRLARQGIYDTKYRYLTDLPDRYERVDCRFRIKGRAPEIWDPLTGTIRKIPLYREENECTTVPLHLGPEGSVFVIFRDESNSPHLVSMEKNGQRLFPLGMGKPGQYQPSIFTENDTLWLEAFNAGDYRCIFSDGQSKTIPVDDPPKEIFIEGEWQLAFPKGWGAPEKVTWKKLRSWTESDVAGIKFFSGTATYRKKIGIPDNWLTDYRLYLDLGNVQELAEVLINGKSTGVLWMPPFTTEITTSLNAGENELEVRVTNLWPNRLIGDQFLPEEQRFTRTNIHKFTTNDQPRVSGLLGPVRIISAKRVPVKF